MICSAVAVIGFSDSSDATGGNEGGIIWELSGNTITFTKRDGHDHPGVMNDYYSDYDRAPWADCGATNLVIMEGVKTIGTYAFYGMPLTSVSLPDSLEKIDNSAFKECAQLTSITIPDNTKLRSEIFWGCDSLSSVIFKNRINFDEQAQETFGHASALHAVYHNGVDLHLNKWPNQDIVFINTNGGTVTSADPALPDDSRFPTTDIYSGPESKTLKAYEIDGIYYGAGDYVPGGKVEATACWDDPAAYTVIVLFMANGHGTAPVYQPHERGETVTPDSPTIDPAEGYDFGGWSLSMDGTKPWDYSTPVYRHLILYAKWIGLATVTFDMNGHGTAPVLDPVPTGTIIKKPDDPTAEGYKFNGWYKERTCQTKWNFDDPVTGDMVLYAEWIVQPCRVNFDMMGHGLGPDPQMVNYGDQVAEPAAISIEGYTFGGWFKDISFENEWNFDSDYVKTDTVLYAKWVSNSSGGNDGATVPVWVLTSVIAGSVVFVGAAILLLRRH